MAQVPQCDKKWLRMQTNHEAKKLYFSERHFLPTEIITESEDTNSRRGRCTNDLIHLKLNALPSIGLDTPSHLSKITSLHSTSFASDAR